jgi:hypothetical protein
LRNAAQVHFKLLEFSMKFLETMWPYFQGEKIEALVFILPIGLVCLVFGGWLLSEGQPGFTRGVAIPFIAMGLVISIIGGTVGFRTQTQAMQIQQAYSTDQANTLKAEGARMEKVNKAWPWYLAIWVVFGILGLGLRLLSNADFWQGLGIALVFFAGLGLIIDGFADRRARIYSNVISELNKAN